MIELDILMHRFIVRLKSVKIPVSDNINPKVKINSRAKKRLGCCIYNGKGYEIEISSALLSEDKSGLLEETIIHELLHTCHGCRNHGTRWKMYAKRVNDIFGYDIQRTVQMDELEENYSQEVAKYILICKKCGAKIPRMRRTNVVKHPERYRCKCGGRISVIESNYQ